MRDAPDITAGHVPTNGGPRRTIGGKLNRLVLLSVAIALVFGAGLSCWGEAKRFLRSKREVMVATAQVFASAASSSVAAGDETAVLRAIRGVARVPHARLRTRDRTFDLAPITAEQVQFPAGVEAERERLDAAPG